MAVTKRRDRTVVFRLTQEEYQRLERACVSTGARNLSDYTRGQLLERSVLKTGRLENRLLNFDRRLSELQDAVRQITRLLEQKSDANS